MLFLFKSDLNILYNCPTAYILGQKDKLVEWGSKLVIYPIYTKGGSVMHGSQIISSMFTHEGLKGSQNDTYWISKSNNSNNSTWLNLIQTSDKIQRLDMDTVVMFNLGPNHPLYFRNKDDLCWYLVNIYPLDIVHISDEYM